MKKIFNAMIVILLALHCMCIPVSAMPVENLELSSANYVESNGDSSLNVKASSTYEMTTFFGKTREEAEQMLKAQGLQYKYYDATASLDAHIGCDELGDIFFIQNKVFFVVSWEKTVCHSSVWGITPGMNLMKIQEIANDAGFIRDNEYTKSNEVWYKSKNPEDYEYLMVHVKNDKASDVQSGSSLRNGVPLAKWWTGKNDANITGLSISPTNLDLAIDESSQIYAVITPSGASSVTWSSSNADVAEISYDGKITAKSEGTAVITARAGNLSATCQVTVTRKATGNNNALNLKKDTFSFRNYPGAGSYDNKKNVWNGYSDRQYFSDITHEDYNNMLKKLSPDDRASVEESINDPKK